jgi:DNA repair protein RecO (recombination protein O)
MLKKTSGIVISYIRYKDTSIIVKIFTREMGLKSYIVNGIRSSSSKNKIGLFQPLTLLDLVVYEKEGAHLNRISEVKILSPFVLIPFDVHRSAVAMFISEVISKSIHDNYQNQSFFDFLQHAVLYLDDESSEISIFPIVFLHESSKFLGFAPGNAKSFFQEVYHLWIHEEEKNETYLAMDYLMQNGFRSKEKIPIQIRRKILDYFIHFYSQHMEIANEFKSIKVLRQLF